MLARVLADLCVPNIGSTAGIHIMRQHVAVFQFMQPV